MKTGFITLPVVLVVIGLLLAGSLFLLIPNPHSSPRDLLPEVQTAMDNYQTFLEQFNRDGKYASRIKVTEKELSFISSDNSEIFYRFTDGNLTREHRGQTSTLLSNLGTVRFSGGQLLPQFVSVFIAYADNQLPSFFTSVAPRGVRP
ncbi:MAG TPA: hypothetical protein PKO06_04110 [Candidatus Ozemobacteraceae bacterium]|nr:hypothetical protein [Candidatus Ozemobacteraceae bacterium]